MKANLVRIATFIAISVGILVQFQNCNWADTFATNSSSTQKLDGGNGYDGKRDQYVIWDETGICPDKILERIEVEYAGTPQQVSFVTRRNCEDIPPEPIVLSSNSFMSYNPSNLVEGTRPLDLYVGTGFVDRTSVLCRGETDKKNKNLHVFADVKITPSTSSPSAGPISSVSPISNFRGKAILGVYDLSSGALIDRQEGENIPLVRNTSDACPKSGCDPAFEYYMSETNSVRNWRLEVPLASGELGTLRIDLENGEVVSSKIPCFRR